MSSRFAVLWVPCRLPRVPSVVELEFDSRTRRSIEGDLFRLSSGIVHQSRRVCLSQNMFTNFHRKVVTLVHVFVGKTSFVSHWSCGVFSYLILVIERKLSKLFGLLTRIRVGLTRAELRVSFAGCFPENECIS